MGEQGTNGSAAGTGDLRGVLADIMRSCAGPLRTADELQAGLRRLASFPLQATMQDSERLTVANAALVARLIMAGALQREESRGAHYRRDFPASREEWRVHMVFGRGQPAYAVEHVAEGVMQAGPPTLDMQTCPLRLPPRTREHEPVLAGAAQ
jgi:L-aspartate oxidase